MRSSIRFILILAVLGAAALACGGPTVNVDVPSGDIIFQDDFSGTSAGWGSITDSDGVTDYLSDGYQIMVSTPQYYLWSNPDNVPSMGDVIVEVSASRRGGPEANDMGIICRYVDENNFYFATAGSDGYFAIYKVKDGTENYIGMDQMGFDDNVINSGMTVNQLRLDCVGSTLTFYVNGTELASASDSDFTEGNVGLIAGSYEEGGVDIFFDNFKVTKP